MADYDGSGHQQQLLYLKICCYPSNGGKRLEIEDKRDYGTYILCLSMPPLHVLGEVQQVVSSRRQS